MMAYPWKGYTLVKISFVKYFCQKAIVIGFSLSSVFFVAMVAWSGDEDEF